MTKKYKLLKDLPGYKAGDVFTKHPSGWWLIDTKIMTGDPVYTLLDNAQDYPDWFAPLQDDEGTPERWRAENYEGIYWYVDSDCIIWNTEDQRTAIHNNRYDIGNYFRTEAQAEAAAEAIRAVLGYIQDTRELSTQYGTGVTTAIDDARDILQNDKENK